MSFNELLTIFGILKRNIKFLIIFEDYFRISKIFPEFEDLYFFFFVFFNSPFFRFFRLYVLLYLTIVIFDHPMMLIRFYMTQLITKKIRFLDIYIRNNKVTWTTNIYSFSSIWQGLTSLVDLDLLYLFLLELHLIWIFYYNFSSIWFIKWLIFEFINFLIFW